MNPTKAEMKRARALQSEWGAEESFIINSTLYLAIPKSGKRTSYTVIVKDMDGLHGIRRLTHPESEFETLAGVRLAILMDVGDWVYE